MLSICADISGDIGHYVSMRQTEHLMRCSSIGFVDMNKSAAVRWISPVLSSCQGLLCHGRGVTRFYFCKTKGC